MTHSYVLAEFVALAQARRLPRLAALDFVTDLVANPDIETIWVGADCRAMSLVRIARPAWEKGDGKWRFSLACVRQAG